MLQQTTGERVGVKDVAEAAGVSMTTVSNVLNGRGRVSAAKADRVRAVMAELGYVRNEAARQLRVGNSRHVGLVVLDLSNPFFVELARGAERRAREEGVHVLIANSDRDSAREDAQVSLFAEQRARGILISPIGQPSQELRRLNNQGVPTVLVDYISDDSSFSSVSVDDVAGGYMAARHLLDTGKRRIAFVGAPSRLRQAKDRLAGARAAVSEFAGASLRVLETEALTIAGGRIIGATIRESFRRSEVDAVFTANDLLGVGVLQALNASRDVQVPGDIAVVGYDDIDIAKDALIPLTSVRQPTELLGYTALDLLMRRQANEPPEQVVFQPELVIRQSSGTVPQRELSAAER